MAEIAGQDDAGLPARTGYRYAGVAIRIGADVARDNEPAEPGPQGDRR